MPRGRVRLEGGCVCVQIYFQKTLNGHNSLKKYPNQAYEMFFDIYFFCRFQKTSHKLNLDNFRVRYGHSKFSEIFFVRVRAPSVRIGAPSVCVRAPSVCVRTPPPSSMRPLGIGAPSLMPLFLLVYILTWRTCGILVVQGKFQFTIDR